VENPSQPTRRTKPQIGTPVELTLVAHSSQMTCRAGLCDHPFAFGLEAGAITLQLDQPIGSLLAGLGGGALSRPTLIRASKPRS